MIIKFIDAETQPGGKALVLCDDNGEMVPQQIECRLNQRLGEAEVTVKLRIDGQQVRFA